MWKNLPFLLFDKHIMKIEVQMKIFVNPLDKLIVLVVP